MEYKKNKTRISLWFNNSRFSKIEINKYFVTNGFSNKNKEMWMKYEFNNINDWLQLLQYELLKRNIILTADDNQRVEKYYDELKNNYYI